MAEELIDILDDKGNYKGLTALKSKAHASGWFHASVHIWFYTSSGKVLFQKRAKHKDTYPGLWDVSVAGHIGAGEIAINSAIREVNEEIGLAIGKKDLEFILKYKSMKKPSKNILDNEFHHVYFSKLSTPIDTLILQQEEVAEVKLFDLNILNKNTIETNMVPHDLKYFKLIYNEIIKRI